MYLRSVWEHWSRPRRSVSPVTSGRWRGRRAIRFLTNISSTAVNSRPPMGVLILSAPAKVRSSTQSVSVTRISTTTVSKAQRRPAPRETTVRGIPQCVSAAPAMRRSRVAMLVRQIGRLEGGAKQTLHLTDTAPSSLVLAVLKHGNQPFLRLFSEGDDGPTCLSGRCPGRGAAGLRS